MSRIKLTPQQELESTRRELARVRAGAVNSNFVQVSKIYIDEMNSLAQYAPSAHLLLWTMVKQMDKKNALMISQESLCKLTRLSAATVKRAVALLREQQWIDVFKVGTSNVYRVNSTVVWQDRADGKWATFSANVVLNFDEQDGITKALTAPIRTRHIPFVEADDINGQQQLALDPAPGE